MSTKSEVSERHLSPINLKHRITGAGVLILFGALILPWMLGPPSEAKKNPSGSAESVEPERHSTFEDEVLAELQGVDTNFEEPEETVYVSKITPVDGQANVGKPVLVEQDKSATEDLSADKVAAAKDSGDKKSSATVETVVKSETPSQPTKTSDNRSTKPKPTKQVAAAPVKKPKVDVGWVVQVELLVDKSGAKKLVDDLKLKGFEPQTTIVDTNKGKKTGTRIWLGPFEQRAEAGKENDKLEAKMGKRGFLRVYP